MAYPHDDKEPIILEGAPDATIKPAQVGEGTRQTMLLEMNSEVLEELLAYARRGKQPIIQFGNNPV
jgi:hypothetical protein